MIPMLKPDSFVDFFNDKARPLNGTEIPEAYLAAALYGLFLREDIETQIEASRYMDAVPLTEMDGIALSEAKIAKAEDKACALADTKRPAADWVEEITRLETRKADLSDIDWERIKDDVAPAYRDLKRTTEIGYPSPIDDYCTAEDARYLSNERKKMALEIFEFCFHKYGKWEQGPALALIIRTYAQSAPTDVPRLEPVGLARQGKLQSNNRAFFNPPRF